MAQMRISVPIGFFMIDFVNVKKWIDKVKKNIYESDNEEKTQTNPS